jgi:hypothetical protein
LPDLDSATEETPMSRHLNKKPPKPLKVKPQKSPHLAANLPDDPTDLFNHCTASWTGLQPLTVAGAVFANIVPAPATIAANLLAVGNALPLAEGGDAIPLANLRAAADTLHATWMLVTKFCEVALRSVPIAQIPAILAQIQIMASRAGHHSQPKPPIAVKQLGSGVVRIDVLALVAVVAYFYEFSVDQITWVPGIQTGRTDGTISGLKPGTLYYFRFKCLKTDDTYTDPSNVVHLFVS